MVIFSLGLVLILVFSAASTGYSSIFLYFNNLQKSLHVCGVNKSGPQEDVFNFQLWCVHHRECVLHS